MKLSILFVDDDANLLQSLQRLLRGQRDRWDMVFAEDSRKAVDLLKDRAFDVVVSDMRMPGLDGAQFLAEAARLNPGSLRVILSGYAEEMSLFRSVGPAHQYLAKPCDPASLIALMDRTQRLQQILGDARLRSVTAGLRNLPSPPELYLRLTEAMGKDDISTNAIARIVSEDVAMMAELLKITNSSYFAVNSRVTTAGQAIRLLGLETVRTLAMAHGVFRQYQGKPYLAEKLRLLNDHSLKLGDLAKRLAKDDGADETTQEEAYCASVLSGIGALVLLDTDADGYQQVSAKIEDVGIEAAERAVFGASHAEIGAYLMGLWGFAEPVIEAVFYKFHPSDCPNQSRCALTYLHLACAFGAPFPGVATPMPPKTMLDRPYVQRLGLAGLAGET